MKTKDFAVLVFLLISAGGLIVFSPEAKQGAYDGLILAQNTIIPSLLPLLIIFLMIMKTGARDVLAKHLGFISRKIFNLPCVSFPAIFLGLCGGYPTGALLTEELFDDGEISASQAKRMLRFNFCGGAGFIITALGTSVIKSTRAGVILFASNVLSSIILGFALSFTEKREKEGFYSFHTDGDFAEALNTSAVSAVKSSLNLTAYIMLFSAAEGVIDVSPAIMPIIEITNGLCSQNNFSLPMISAYLAFGGLCIHFQLLSVMKHIGMKLWDFILFRGIGAILSAGICRVLVIIFPFEQSVFANSAETVKFASVNTALSVLMIIGCFVSVADVTAHCLRRA